MELVKTKGRRIREETMYYSLLSIRVNGWQEDGNITLQKNYLKANVIITIVFKIVLKMSFKDKIQIMIIGRKC